MNEEVKIADPVRQGHELITALREEIRKVFIGQEAVIDQVLVALIAGGHVLVEGVPGLGKTLLVRALSRCLSAHFARVQFTPDLMPSDITGHSLYNMKEQQFEVRKGPVFTNLLLADEINRAPAKTQAALLEVMQERQITIEGQTFTTGDPFMVLATQNPVEQEGTYPLPEAELDRFMLKIQIDYPEQEDEARLVRQVTRQAGLAGFRLEGVQPVADSARLQALQQLASRILVDDQVLDYAIALVRASRDWIGIARGAGPRASIALVVAARARALMEGQGFVTPAHVKQVATPVLRHRLLLSAELEIEGVSVDRVLADILDQVAAPRL